VFFSYGAAKKLATDQVIMNRVIRHPGPPHLPLSRAVCAGGFAFLSGVLPVDAAGAPLSGTIADETRAALEQVRRQLEAIGLSLKDVVRTSVWLSDLTDFAAFNSVYADYFLGHLPARSTVEAALVRGAKIEIEVQAWIGCDSEASERSVTR
jgi:2-iminobutanoate/2-iminopropanoate deaminase